MRTVVLCSFLTILLVTGCSSYFKRKSCEKVNWHEHGFKVAMQGNRLTGDELYDSCQKVEAEINHADVDAGWKAGMTKYCSSEGAFEKGRSGQKYSLSFCDKNEGSPTHGAYRKGLRQFCQADNAYAFGAGGGVYQQVCTSEEEVAWRPEYNRGRKFYLQGEVQTRRQMITQIDGEVDQYESERRDVLNQIALLPSSKVARTERSYDPETKKYTEVTKVSEDEETKDNRRNLQWNLDRVTNSIKNARKRQTSLRSEINQLQSEIRLLNQ